MTVRHRLPLVVLPLVLVFLVATLLSCASAECKRSRLWFSRGDRESPVSRSRHPLRVPSLVPGGRKGECEEQRLSS